MSRKNAESVKKLADLLDLADEVFAEYRRRKGDEAPGQFDLDLKDKLFVAQIISSNGIVDEINATVQERLDKVMEVVGEQIEAIKSHVGLGGTAPAPPPAPVGAPVQTPPGVQVRPAAPVDAKRPPPPTPDQIRAAHAAFMKVAHSKGIDVKTWDKMAELLISSPEGVTCLHAMMFQVHPEAHARTAAQRATPTPQSPPTTKKSK